MLSIICVGVSFTVLNTEYLMHFSANLWELLLQPSIMSVSSKVFMYIVRTQGAATNIESWEVEGAATNIEIF